MATTSARADSPEEDPFPIPEAHGLYCPERGLLCGPHTRYDVQRGGTRACRVHVEAGRVAVEECGSVLRFMTWGSDDTWPERILERWLGQTKRDLKSLGGGRYAVEPGPDGAPPRDTLIADHVQREVVLRRDLTEESRTVVARFAPSSRPLSVYFDEAWTPQYVTRKDDGGEHLAYTVRRVESGPGFDLLRFERTAPDAPALVAGLLAEIDSLRSTWTVGRIDGMPIYMSDEHGDLLDGRPDAGFFAETWRNSALGQLVRWLSGADPTGPRSDLQLAIEPPEPVPPLLRLGGATIASTLSQNAEFLFVVGLNIAALLALVLVLVALRPSSRRARPTPRPRTVEVVSASLEPRVRPYLTALGEALGIPRSAAAREAWIEGLLDTVALARARRPDVPVPSDLGALVVLGTEAGAGVQPAEAPSRLRDVAIREALAYPAGEGGLGELAGRATLVQALTRRIGQAIEEGRLEAEAALQQKEVAFWRDVLRDQIARLETLRRRKWSWRLARQRKRESGQWRRGRSALSSDVLTRLDLFLCEDLDELYRHDPHAYETVIERVRDLGLAEAASTPGQIQNIVDRVLTAMVPDRIHFGIFGLFAVLLGIFRPSFWRGRRVGLPGGATERRASARKVVFWTTAIVASCSVSFWLLSATVPFIVRTAEAGQPAVWVGLIPLVLSQPLVWRALVTFMSAVAAWDAAARAGALPARRWPGSRRQLRALAAPQDAAEATGASAPVAAEATTPELTWPELVDALRADHKLSEVEHRKLRSGTGELAEPRNPEAAERLRRWANKQGRERIAPPSWDRLPSLTWFISSYAERYWYPLEELVAAGSQDHLETRLAYLARCYADEWDNLLEQLPAASREVLRRELHDGGEVSRRALPADTIVAIERWANRRLPTNWRLLESLESLRATMRRAARGHVATPRHLQLLSRREGGEVLAAKDSAELAAAEARVEALVAQKLQVLLREDACTPTGATAVDIARARADVERRGWDFASFEPSEVIHHSKYGGWSRALHKVRGEVMFASDSHMELPAEEAAPILDVLSRFAAEPDLGGVVPGIAAYGERFSDVARQMARTESVWATTEQRRKDATDAPLVAGKFFVRVEQLKSFGGLQDDYVSEDAMTGFALQSAGLRVRFDGDVLLRWRVPVNLAAASVPLGKYAAGSAEFIVGRCFRSYLTSRRVPWTEKLGAVHTALFYFYQALATWLVFSAMVLGYSLSLTEFVGLPDPFLFGLLFVVTAQSSVVTTAVFCRERTGSWLRGLARAVRFTVSGFVFHAIFMPYYVRMFRRGLYWSAVFHMTPKTPDVSSGDVDGIRRRLQPTFSYGLILLGFALLGHFSPARALLWSVPLLVVLSWVVGPYFYAIAGDAPVRTASLRRGLEGLSHALRVLGPLRWPLTALIAPFTVPPWLLVGCIACSRAKRLSATVGVVVAVWGGVAATSAVRSEPTAAPVAAVAAPRDPTRDPLMDWWTHRRTAAGLVISNVGDPRINGWAVLYDQLVVIEALWGRGMDAEAVELLTRVWDLFPQGQDGLRVNAVHATQPSHVTEWRTHVGPNAHLGRQCIEAFYRTRDAIWLERAREVARLLTRRFDGVALPQQDASGDKDDARARDIYSVEENFAALTFLEGLRDLGDREYEPVRRGIRQLVERAVTADGGLTAGLVRANAAPLATRYVSDAQGIAMSVLGRRGLASIMHGPASGLVSFVDREFLVRSPSGEPLGFDFGDNLKPRVVAVEWSAQVVAGLRRLARDAWEDGAVDEAVALATRVEALRRSLHALLDGRAPRRIAYRPDGLPSGPRGTWITYYAIPSGESVVGLAYLDAVEHGRDPVGPIQAERTRPEPLPPLPTIDPAAGPSALAGFGPVVLDAPGRHLVEPCGDGCWRIRFEPSGEGGGEATVAWMADGRASTAFRLAGGAPQAVRVELRSRVGEPHLWLDAGSLSLARGHVAHGVPVTLGADWSEQRLPLRAESTGAALTRIFAWRGELDATAPLEIEVRGLRLETEASSRPAAPETACDDEPVSVDPGVAGWRLVYSDEFSGADVPAGWVPDLGNGLNGWGHAEQQVYTADHANLAVRDGCLRIAARVDEDGSVTSARVRSERAFRRGRVEIRARMPRGRALWPALRLLPEGYRYGTAAAPGEIGVAEVIGHRTDEVEVSLRKDEADAARDDRGEVWRVDDLAAGFHVYAVEWSPGKVVYSLDGRELQRLAPDQAALSDILDKPFSVSMSLAVGGTRASDELTVEPDLNALPAELLVDYVRVYEPVEAP